MCIRFELSIQELHSHRLIDGYFFFFFFFFFLYSEISFNIAKINNLAIPGGGGGSGPAVLPSGSAHVERAGFLTAFLVYECTALYTVSFTNGHGARKPSFVRVHFYFKNVHGQTA